MAKKKPKSKNKLAKNAPKDITIDDINWAVDELLLNDPVVVEEIIQDITSKKEHAYCLNVGSFDLLDEFSIVLDMTLDQMVFDVRPIEDFLLSGLVPDNKRVWVLTEQAFDESFKCPYNVQYTTKKQEEALKCCQSRINNLASIFPISSTMLDIHVSKRKFTNDDHVNDEYIIELFVKQYDVTFRISSSRISNRFDE